MALKRLTVVRLLSLLAASDHPWSARWRAREVGPVRRVAEGALGVLLVLFLAEGCRRDAAPDAGAEDASEVAAADAEPEIPPPPPAVIPPPTGPWAVVLVAPDDVLNVRAAPEPAAAQVAVLRPDARGVVGTGERRAVGGAEWLRVQVGTETGWVNAAYLTEDVDAARFRGDDRVLTLLASLSGAVRSRGSMATLIAPRGLYLAHFAAPRRLPPADAAALWADQTRRSFNGAACGEDCVQGTFREVLGEAYLDAYEDADKRLGFDDWLQGGNASAPRPAVLAGFHFVTVYDPGDEPEVPDWEAVTVFVEYVAGTPKVVGLARNAWSP